MGDAYEYLLKQFAEDAKKNGGQFYTPRSVVKLLVKILDPKSGETVYDPTCGTGGMLIESIRHMDNQKMAYGKIFGQEINMTTSAIARMNLYLHGAHDFTIEQGDTLRTPKFFKGGQIKTFDNVIANPPFGLSGWGADAFETDQYGRNIWGCPSDSNADFAWIQHMVASMDPIHGKCVVIMPQGVLFHGGKEGEIRKKLIESDKVEAVITFVGGLFFGAGVSACVLCLNNDKPAAHRGKVLLVDGSTIYTAKRAQNIMSDEDVEKAFKLYQDYTDVVGYSKVVTLADLEKNGYTLAVNSYIEKPPAPPIDPVKVKQEYFAALDNVKECEERLYQLLKEGGYLE
jgi:type I restriction enzyme M protein